MNIYIYIHFYTLWYESTHTLIQTDIHTLIFAPKLYLVYHFNTWSYMGSHHQKTQYLCVFCFFVATVYYTLHSPDESIPPLTPSFPPSVSILRCWWLFGELLCSLFREAAWPCSSLLILTFFKLALPSPSWVLLPHYIPFSFSKVPVSCSSHRLPLWLFYLKCICSSLWSHRLAGLWQIRTAVCNRGGLGCFCIPLGVSVSFNIAAFSRCLSLSPFPSLCV